VAKDRRPWNAGRMVGAKRALKPQQVWAIRFWLDRERRLRDRAMFDLAIDSKLRGCDVVKIKIGALVSGGRVRSRAIVIPTVIKNDGWYESLFGAPPPANPARNTNRRKRWKSQRFRRLVLVLDFSERAREADGLYRRWSVLAQDVAVTSDLTQQLLANLRQRRLIIEMDEGPTIDLLERRCSREEALARGLPVNVAWELSVWDRRLAQFKFWSRR
jgi:hypothetical protein